MEIQFDKFLEIIEKIILPVTILITGYTITRSIEKIKSNEAFKNEITKIRVERIAKFYDLFSEYEHWVNRLITHVYMLTKENKRYLSDLEFSEATKKADEISKIIGFELNQMRFWINDDIYFHTMAQLENFKDMQSEMLIRTNFDSIEKFRYRGDSIRMNIDKLIPYLKSKQNLKLISYDRSFLYKKKN